MIYSIFNNFLFVEIFFAHNSIMNPLNNPLLLTKVELVNFMCHENFCITFEKLITCITGRNGSGKSAVMVAMGVIFGQRVTSMDRGNSLEALIKSGKTHACIKIYIRNIYKLTGFEDEIVIEKQIFRGKKANTLRIMKNKKFIGLNRNTLMYLMGEFKLNFNNPLNFLTQDNSKKILNVKSPSDLYDFYYVGTEFKDIQEEIEEAERRNDEMAEKVLQSTETLKDIAKSLERAKKSLKFLNIDRKKILEDLLLEEKWSELKIKKREMEKIVKEVAEQEEEIYVNEGKIAEIMSKSLVFKPVDLTEITKELDEKEIGYKNIMGDFTDMEKDYERRRTQLEAAMSRNDKEKLESKIEAIKKEYEIQQEKQKETLEELQKMSEDVYAEKERNEKMRQKRSNLLHQLNFLEKNKKDSFTENMLRKFDAIEHEINKIKFRDKVIGPICKYLKLKDKKWYKPASIILKKSLESFVVFNSEDKSALFQLFKKSGVKYSIFQLSTKETVNPRILSNFTTLLSVLETKEDILKNILITMHNAEEVILLENREEAYDTVQKEGRRINCAYITTGDRIKLVNGRLSDYKDRDSGNYYFEDYTSKIETIREKLKEIEISSIYESRKREKEKENSQISSEIEKAEKDLRNLKIELKSYESVKDDDLNQVKRKLRVLNTQKENLENKKNKLKHELDLLKEKKQEMEEENLRIKNDCKKNEEKKRIQVEKFESKARFARSLKEQKEKERQRLLKVIEEEKEALLKEKNEEIDSRSKKVIEEEKTEIKAAIMQAEEMGKKEKYEKEVSELKGKEETLNSILQKFKDSLRATAKAISARKLKRDEIKVKKTQEAAEIFKNTTRKSGYEGELIFDHENKKLDIKMRVHNNKIKGGKNTLSGGERSFAGLSFLLSLWSSFSCPIKILDEFDVFMDSINRKNAIKSLFDHVKKERTQTILITPLDVTDMADEECSIKQLTKINN
ncbi:hypothetical protein NUSPORA_01673 [Nucleospora cyclopteri]